MKKVVSLLLVLVLALGMSTMAFAANKVAIDGGAPVYFPDMSFGDSAVPGAEIVRDMPVGVGGFTLKTGDGFTTSVATAGLTKSEISSSKLTLKTRISKGSAAIDTVELAYVAAKDSSNRDVKVAKLKAVLVKPFVSTNTDGLEFEATAYFMIDSTSWLSNGTLISGTLKNDFSENVVDKDTDYFDMSLGTIMKPSELVKSMEYYLGENVSLFGRALKGTKYYGVANTKSTADDDANILKYDLDGVYHIKAVNLEGVTSYVVLGDADATQYIYDGEMKYLGRGNEHLPYATTYYLSAKELDTDSGDAEPTEEDSSEEDTSAPNPGTGADDSYPTNVNDNPGTGR